MTWEKAKLENCCEVTSSKRIFYSEYVDNGIPFYRSKEIIEKKQGKLISEPLYISEEKYEEIKNKFGVPCVGDMLLTSVGTIGIPYIVKSTDKFYFKDGNLTWFKNFNNKLLSKYLFYWICSPKGAKTLYNTTIGSSQKALTIAALKNIEIELPALKIQNKIVSILSAYDDLIENNQKQIKLLEEAAQRLYKEWFVDLRFPGYETTLIIDGVPEGWEHTILENVISKITTGLNPRKNFVLGNGNNYYVTIKNMRNNNIYLDEKCDRIDDEAIIKINKRSDLQVGDILFSGIGTMGRVYLVNIPTDNWNVSESVFTLRANNKISKEFLYLMLLSDDVQIYCDQHAHGVAQRGIRMTDLKAYKFILPSKKIIENFTAIIKPIVEKIQNLHVQIVDVTEARDRLLPKLMSGELEG